MVLTEKQKIMLFQILCDSIRYADDDAFYINRKIREELWTEILLLQERFEEKSVPNIPC